MLMTFDLQWDAGEERVQSPSAARYGDGNLSVRQALEGKQRVVSRVGWSNALGQCRQKFRLRRTRACMCMCMFFVCVEQTRTGTCAWCGVVASLFREPLRSFER